MYKLGILCIFKSCILNHYFIIPGTFSLRFYLSLRTLDMYLANSTALKEFIYVFPG